MSENTQLIICLVIFAASLISYLLNKIPMWITAMGALVLLVVTGCLDMTTALSGLSNTNTVLMGSMFVVAAGLRKTTFVDTLCTGVMKLTRGSFRKAYFGYLLIAVLLAQLIPSPMVVFAIVSPCWPNCVRRWARASPRSCSPGGGRHRHHRHPAPGQRRLRRRPVQRLHADL